MKELLALVGPVLEGAPDTTGIKNLHIYQRFCAAHRNTALAHVYAYVKEQMGDAWPETVEAYFRAFPMHHVEINQNGAAFPQFLSGWLAELADFEWWEWQTRITAGSEQGGLAPTVELRPYHYDFIDWDRAAPPKEQQTLVVFWRDLKDQPRRERVSPAELQVLKEVFAGATPEGPTADDLRAAGILR